MRHAHGPTAVPDQQPVSFQGDECAACVGGARGLDEGGAGVHDVVDQAAHHDFVEPALRAVVGRLDELDLRVPCGEQGQDVAIPALADRPRQGPDLVTVAVHLIEADDAPCQGR